MKEKYKEKLTTEFWSFATVLSVLLQHRIDCNVRSSLVFTAESTPLYLFGLQARNKTLLLGEWIKPRRMNHALAAVAIFMCLRNLPKKAICCYNSLLFILLFLSFRRYNLFQLCIILVFITNKIHTTFGTKVFISPQILIHICILSVLKFLIFHLR